MNAHTHAHTIYEPLQERMKLCSNPSLLACRYQLQREATPQTPTSQQLQQGSVEGHVARHVQHRVVAQVGGHGRYQARLAQQLRHHLRQQPLLRRRRVGGSGGRPLSSILLLVLAKEVFRDVAPRVDVTPKHLRR